MDHGRHVPKFFDRLKYESIMKIMEEQGVGARFLVRNTLGVKGMLELRDGTRKIDKQFTYSHGIAQTKQQVS